MKYAVIIFDGAADYPCEALSGKTPLAVADKPCLDSLTKKALCGTVSNVPPDMIPESDTANIAILSYDPKIYSKGRSPLEAVSMGLEMAPEDTAFRANIVTLGGEGAYEDLTMIDHSSDEITTEEADVLIKAVDKELGTPDIRFHTGVSYRHCLLWKNAPQYSDFMRPHDILTQGIKEYLPPEPFLTMQKKSYELLSSHPLNLDRQKCGLRPANSLWLWSPGKKPALPSFKEKWGLNGTVISAVDLIKGIGICAGLKTVNVEGATGNINTNFSGKADAAIKAFKDGDDFVFVHVEAPDECGHRAELENKIRSIGLIDSKIVSPIYDYLCSLGGDFKIMVLPDHPTPICTRTHAPEPVPFMIYSSNNETDGAERFDEKSCEAKGNYIEHGYTLLDRMIERKTK